MASTDLLSSTTATCGYGLTAIRQTAIVSLGVKQRTADELIRNELVKDENEPICLTEKMRGHERVYEIDWTTAPDAEWYGRVGTI